jgi:hypothetical protein
MHVAKLGPVIGTICDNHIRILLECDFSLFELDKPIQITVSSGGETTTQYFPYKNGAMILRLELLNREDTHILTFDNLLSDDQLTICSFNPVVSSVAVISCDGVTDNKAKAWDLANNTKISHALHIGDQVYVDEAYDIGMKRIDDTGLDAAYVFDEEIRKIYYDSWFHCREKRAFLANHINIMIIDDHEIYDNFTSTDFRENVYPRKYMDVFINVAARIAGEYQIGLSQDAIVAKFSDLRKIDKVSFLEGDDMKFVIVNSRLTKTDKWMFDDATKQTIRENIQTEKKLVFVDQVSPFIVSHNYTQFKLLFKLGGIDITDHITYNECWVRDYNWLFDILSQSNAREIVYATGDLHVGQNHTLFGKSGTIQCLTSSPMSSNVAMKPDSPMRFLADFIAHKYDGFSYTNNLICHNNFAVITNKLNKTVVIT